MNTMTKTITIEIPVKEYYQQEFQKLKNRETGLRQKIKNTKSSNAAFVSSKRRLSSELLDTPKTRDHRVFASGVPKTEIIFMLSNGYELDVGLDQDYEPQVCLTKTVYETSTEINERIHGALMKMNYLDERIEAEQLILQNLEKELTELEAEIEGFWKDPIRQANLANA